MLNLILQITTKLDTCITGDVSSVGGESGNLLGVTPSFQLFLKVVDDTVMFL